MDRWASLCATPRSPPRTFGPYRRFESSTSRMPEREDVSFVSQSTDFSGCVAVLTSWDSRRTTLPDRSSTRGEAWNFVPTPYPPYTSRARCTPSAHIFRACHRFSSIHNAFCLSVACMKHSERERNQLRNVQEEKDSAYLPCLLRLAEVRERPRPQIPTFALLALLSPPRDRTISSWGNVGHNVTASHVYDIIWPLCTWPVPFHQVGRVRLLKFIKSRTGFLQKPK